MDANEILKRLATLHLELANEIASEAGRCSSSELSAVAFDGEGDTIYFLDRIGEDRLIDALSDLAAKEPILLVAEGISGGELVLPRGADRDGVRWRIIMDPIDGTRGLMYQKRPAWILSAIAPERGEETRLSHIVAAVQTEIPLHKQFCFDQIVGDAQGGLVSRRHVRREYCDVIDVDPLSCSLKPSRATGLEHGFAQISRFIPGGRDILASLDEELIEAVVGPPVAGKALVFEDQYLSTGGQLYELMMGHDRFIADLRPLLAGPLAERGQAHSLCCKPYDLCTAVLAQRAGVIISDARGQKLDGPLDVRADLAWVGYANASLRAKIEPVLISILSRRGLI